MNEEMSIIRLKNIGKIYNIGRPNACEALKGADLEIRRGDLISVTGESGSGKSTLMHIIGCLDSPTSGELYFNEKKVNFKNTKTLAEIRNKRVGFVLQDFGLILGETALENVSVPLLFSDISVTKMRSRAHEVLKLLGIDELAGKRADQLSGGQKQRVAIARALVNDPDVILADEPTGALDSKTSAEIIDILLKLNENGRTVIIVTHDIKIADLCRRKISITDGCLSE